MKNRKKQRENRRLRSDEEALDKRSAFGFKDLTHYNTARRIQSGGKAVIALR